MSFSQTEARWAQKSRAYDGETYYGRPALKPSPYGQLIASYFFVGGLAGAAQFIAGIADVYGHDDDQPVVRAGRYIGLTGIMLSPVLLIADLRTPRRWYNMLRIFRRTSAMSIGAWTLTGFGLLSGVAAAAQALYARTGSVAYRRVARYVGVPAALAGGAVTTYTGTLLAATSTPLWAAGSRLLPALFSVSAATTATAALSLVTQRTATSESATRLDNLALMAGGAELALATALDRQWQQQGVATPLRQQPTATAYRVGFYGLGMLTPLLLHGLHRLMQRRSRTVSTLAFVATLAGGYMLRSVLISAGNASAQRPDDYFQFIQPRAATQPQPQHSPPTLAAQCQQAVDRLKQALHEPPSCLGKDVDAVEQIVTQLRDRLIHRLRQTGSSPEATRWQTALERINAALSLIVGVEYPIAGIQRTAIAQASATLAQVLTDRLLV
jgi:formate-dependent nitrite reductase membrane component NrfD